MPRAKSYVTPTKDNLKKLENLAEQMEDFKLYKALCGKDVTERKRFEILWDTYKGLAEGDNTKVATDGRASLSSRYNENYKRWKQLSQWADTDTDSKYADFYAQERQMLEWYVTESLVDIYTAFAE